MISASAMIRGLHGAGIPAGSSPPMPLPPALAPHRCEVCGVEIRNAPIKNLIWTERELHDVCSWHCALVMIEREAAEIETQAARLFAEALDPLSGAA